MNVNDIISCHFDHDIEHLQCLSKYQFPRYWSRKFPLTDGLHSAVHDTSSCMFHDLESGCSVPLDQVW